MNKIEVKSDELREALSIVVPRKKKKAKKGFPIIFFEEAKGALTVTDAKYEAKGAVLNAKGNSSESFEVDGYILKALTEKYPDNSVLILNVSKACVEIQSGVSSVKISRLDSDGKKTIKKPLPHNGKPEHLPEPTEKRAEFNDTWGFSARVPMPASATKDRDN